jgi:hypothetical protein
MAPSKVSKSLSDANGVINRREERRSLPHGTREQPDGNISFLRLVNPLCR